MMQANLDSAPPSPPGPSRREMSNLGWGAKPEGGLGPEASDPQVKALQGVKLIEMGAQLLATAQPELAGPVQQFVQQLSMMVTQGMSQNMSSAPANMTGGPSPVPATPTGY